MKTDIFLIIATAVHFTVVGVVLGVLLAGRGKCPEDLSAALEGCEVSMAAHELELQETRAYLQSCTGILEDNLFLRR